MFLRYMEKNFLENCVTTPTREENTLDLCLSNNHTLINFYKTTINHSFSDHNTLEFDLNFSYNLDVKREKKTNPYKSRIYEYETEMADEEDWMRFSKLLDKTNVEEEFGGLQNVHTKIHKFIQLLESLTALVFKKKKAFQEEEESTGKEMKRKNKIPKKIRQFMKRQKKLSNQIYSSISWENNFKKIQELDEIEKELQNSYKENRVKKEQEGQAELLLVRMASLPSC